MKLAHSFVGALLVSMSLGAVAPRAARPVLPAALVGNICVQDQFGNRYSFRVDPTHKFLGGSALNNQGCATPWPLTGSYVETPGGLLVELTAANPDGIFGYPCIATYKLKGIYPNFAWYYEDGYGGQESTFVACGSRVTANPSSGGALGRP